MGENISHTQTIALFTSVFFDELTRWGVSDVVVSPGSRSTPLAMTAYELSRRYPDRLAVHVDIDERSAGFFALGLAKATGRPAALVCTSGTAPAHYYPAVLEAESSRVPMIVLSGDRPMRLQGLGAPQTCDQLNMFGSHVRQFRQMPEPGSAPAMLNFARQAAREACIAAGGKPSAIHGDPVASCGSSVLAGPVHVNFPFDEPLKPDFSVEGLFDAERRSVDGGMYPFGQVDRFGLVNSADRGGIPDPMSPCLHSRALLASADYRRIHGLIQRHDVLVLVGEGTCETVKEAEAVITWADRLDIPLVADPLSGLRSFDDPIVIDNYDSMISSGDLPMPTLVIRFGRYPVSKRMVQAMAAWNPVNLVVDRGETRDFNAATDLFVSCDPAGFVRGYLRYLDSLDTVTHAQRGKHARSSEEGQDGIAHTADNSAADTGVIGSPIPEAADAEHGVGQWSANGDREEPEAGTDTKDEGKSGGDQWTFCRSWVALNDGTRQRVMAASMAEPPIEGSYLGALLEEIPPGSCLFCANSMAVRALDTFYVKQDKLVRVLGNRGLNGIDGTVSAAVGAAYAASPVTLVTGDLALQHDVGGLSLQREIMAGRRLSEEGEPPGEDAPSVVIVLLNNNGGAIFDMLPQRSEEPYFERLFLTPQDIDFSSVVTGFHVPFRAVDSVVEFRDAYRQWVGLPGLHLIEVRLPLRGIQVRYGPYQ